MKANRILVVLVIAASMAAAGREPRRISRKSLEDKIRGGWAGQMIGVSYGAPTEFRSNGKINEAEIRWTPAGVSNAIGQDDLYVEMTFAEVMDKYGIDAPIERYAEMFRDSKYSLWHANAGARRLLNNGVAAPMSGNPKYNAHANDIDFQIESDFIGLMAPGLPRVASRLADRVGHVMNYGDGVYGGVFFGGMYAAAFFENDPRRVVEAGMACLPPKSGYAQVIRDLLGWSAKYPEDWKQTWRALEEKWDRDDPCPDGALAPFNIDARLNGAYVALGLLYGRGDFARTLEVSTRSGQDSDCNPSSAAGVLGVMVGYDKIPDEWKSGIPSLADKKFQFTQYSFNDIVRSTMDRALKAIRTAGGQTDGEEIVIPAQSPEPPKLEQWDPGRPERRFSAKDSAWQWKGNWKDEKGARVSEAGGNETTLSFDGTGIVLIGDYSQTGGRAEVYLDGKRAGEINAYIVERTHDNDLWHVFDLKPGSHTIRVVSLDSADPRSKGKVLAMSSAVSYRAK
jgi:hypothetical protein